MWPNAKSCFKNIEKVQRYWRKPYALSLDSDLALCSIFFLCRFLILNKFSIFFQWEESLQIRKKYYADNIKCTQCWEFKAINDYRSRNGLKWQKVQLRHFLSNYLLCWGSYQKWFFCSLQSENRFFWKRYNE